VTLPDQRWRAEAACKGAPISLFFSDSNEAEAKAICAKCPVLTQCRSFFLQEEWNLDKWGVFGGLTPAERKEARAKGTI
jgi:WhiB family redox-sensing transcriptional regulator